MIVFTNVGFANIYEEQSYKSAIVTQSVLWEKLEVLSRVKNYSQIRCEDNYEGWISNHQICIPDFGYSLKMVTGRNCFVYENKGKNYPVIRNMGAGSYIAPLNENNGWIEIILPDGKKGWVRKNSINLKAGSERECLIYYATRLLGIPYFWGGKTTAGLDCSGFIQLVHKLTGLKIRRDSQQQFDDARPVGNNFSDGQPGDLLFFSENRNKITHVALKLPDDMVIHARGMVKTNSLNKNNPLFDAVLKEEFIEVKTFLD